MTNTDFTSSQASGQAKKSTGATYSTYVLRMWQEDETGAWRATVKDVREGKQHNFTSLEPLLNFIKQHNQLSESLP